MRRSTPSERSATGDLLAQRCLRAPQQSSDLSYAHAERPRDLGVAEPARPKHQNRRRLGSHPSEGLPQAAAVLLELGLLFGVERPLPFLHCLPQLTLLAPPPAAEAVQRR